MCQAHAPSPPLFRILCINAACRCRLRDAVLVLCALRLSL